MGSGMTKELGMLLLIIWRCVSFHDLNLWSKVVCENNCQYTYWFSLRTNATPQRSEELGLFVVDEEDNETLLMHRISSDEIYRKQEGIILAFALGFCIYSFSVVCCLR